MGSSNRLPTAFAPAERAAPDVIEALYRRLSALPLFSAVLDGVPDLIVVLESHRQIVYCNRALLFYCALDDVRKFLGLRPGEVLHCTHAFETEGGCGTTRFCRTCGAVQAILQAQNGVSDVQECRVVQKESGTALDFRVWATPIRILDTDLTLFVLQDITHEKRRAVLERAFFHDLLNTAGAIQTAIEMMQSTETEASENKELLDVVGQGAAFIIEEIESHRTLLSAESGTLAVNRQRVSSIGVLQNVLNLMQRHEVAAGRTLQISSESEDVSFVSDPTLLRRILVNMTKNALEATPPGGVVTLDCRLVDEGRAVEFRVHNDGEIPPDVRLQIFQRSFSTKGPGRGIGTYSMKLLAERYLGGEVYFRTSAREGTTFFARFPIEPARESAEARFRPA